MLFSIIIPVYNSEKTIGKCLDSIFKQSFSDFEVVVVNDGSTDRSRDIVAKYNVRQIIFEENRGPAAARNAGIKNSLGEIIVFIDSDVAFNDTAALVKLKKVFDERQDVDGAIMFKEKVPLNAGLTPLFWAYYKHYLWSFPGEYQTSFLTERSAVRKRVFEAVGYFNEKYKKADVEDWEFGYRMNEAGFKILIVRDIKVLHHFETFKQTTIKSLKRSGQWIRLFLKRRKFDPIYSTRERGIKTLFAASLPLLLIPAIVWRPISWLLVLNFSIYSYYNFGFYLYLAREKKYFFILPFMILDIYISFLIFLGSGSSVISLFLVNVYKSLCRIVSFFGKRSCRN